MFCADAINFPKVYFVVSGLQKHLRTLHRALQTLTSVNLRLNLKLKTLFWIIKNNHVKITDVNDVEITFQV